MQDKASTKPVSAFTQITPQEDSSPINQPTPVAEIFEEVNKPKEVDDNICHHLTEKVQPPASASSISNEGEWHQMDMDKTSSRETSEQDDTKHTTSHDNPKPTHNAHQQLKTAETLPNVEQPDMETNPTVKKESKKMSTSKPTSSPRNILS